MRVLFAPIVTLALLVSLGVGAQTLNLPPRPADAPTGSEFVALITDLERVAREEVIYDAVLSGNVPDFMRNLVPVTVTENISGTDHTAVFYVAPDYMAIGTNEDYFLCPMTPILAQWICDEIGCLLPTRKMVNAIWQAAPAHFDPQPIPPSPAMTTVPVFNDHNTIVWGQRSAVLGTYPLGTLVGGTKKDVVITPQLHDGAHDNKVAIYGWHYLTGTPIQPLYLGHVDWYADYSHGIRFVQSAATLDGNPTTVETILKDPVLTVLLNDEAVFTDTRYPAGPPPEQLPITDSFPSTGPESTSWTGRFTTPQVIPFSPTSPAGDGYVFQVRDPSGGIDTARVGRATTTDVSVQSDIYCQLRTDVVADGFERVGIFVRDDGNGMFEGISGGGVQANGYALTWDSGDGRVQCLRTVNGVPTDLLPSPVHMASTAWRRFRIDAIGDQLSFFIDGEPLLTTADSTHPMGQVGIGFHEYFATNANLLGTRADNFSASTSPPPSVNGVVIH